MAASRSAVPSADRLEGSQASVEGSEMVIHVPLCLNWARLGFLVPGLPNGGVCCLAGMLELVCRKINCQEVSLFTGIKLCVGLKEEKGRVVETYCPSHD